MRQGDQPIKLYIDCNGRAPRAEYWYFILFNMLVGTAAEIIDAIAFGYRSSTTPISWMATLLLLLPNLTVSVRRLHDINRNGKWLVLLFIPVIGWIVLFVWACTRGTRGPNDFGADQLPGRPAFAPPVPAA